MSEEIKEGLSEGVISKRVIGKIERKPKFFYYVDKDGIIWEAEMDWRRSSRVDIAELEKEELRRGERQDPPRA
ncbi:MAG: hypothetical protein NZ992_00255 [Candidatus Korarchaeum sp.]|nr:hypothetical protein [Candidatus Korarchaeum sp.]MDW8093371.1 hypothetical protein [Nitrososphaerota archaeon]